MDATFRYHHTDEGPAIHERCAAHDGQPCRTSRVRVGGREVWAHFDDGEVLLAFPDEIEAR